MPGGIFVITYNKLIILGYSQDEGEIIVLAFEALHGLDSEKDYEEYNGSIETLKIKYAPRNFDTYQMTSAKKAFILYWSQKSGARIVEPVWKLKDGIYRMDKEECANKVRDMVAQGMSRKALVKDYKFINVANRVAGCDYQFGKKGYFTNNDTSFDWSQNVFTFCYMKSAFKIDGHPIDKFTVSTSMESKVLDSTIISTVNGAEWTVDDLYEFVMSLDDYDTHICIYYHDGDKQVKERLRLNGRRVDFGTDMFGVKERIEAAKR